jgi:hypothetical protein
MPQFLKTRYLSTVGLCLLATALLLPGCATPKFSGIEEYQKLTTEATTATRACVQALTRLSARPGPPLPKATADFERSVQRLQVNSIRIRARARAIRTRGDDYFASWEQNMAAIKNARLRQAADRSHAELQTSFSKIKLASEKAGAAFDPFISGLQQLRIELEKPSGRVDGDEHRDLLDRTTANGNEVLQELGVINSELSTMKKLIRSRYHGSL